MPLITKEGFSFGFDPDACDACGGKCCKGEAGHVWVTSEEIRAIADCLNLEVAVFIKDYVVMVKNSFSVKELRIRGKLECALLDQEGRRCAVYPVRPQQCRTYPFWDCFKENINAAIKECAGVRPLEKCK